MDLLEDIIQGLGDAPRRIMRLHLGQIADVADVVPFPVLVHILPLHGFAGNGGDFLEGFKDGDTVVTTATDVVHLAAAGIIKEGVDEADDVQAMNVVPHLLAFVAEDVVLFSGKVALDEVAEEAVEFDTAVVRASETATAQGAAFHAKVAPVFLHHDVGSDFRRTE